MLIKWGDRIVCVFAGVMLAGFAGFIAVDIQMRDCQDAAERLVRFYSKKMEGGVYLDDTLYYKGKRVAKVCLDDQTCWTLKPLETTK